MTEKTHDVEYASSELSGRTTIVVGASRGLGHGVATAFAGAGASVVAVSRTAAEFGEPTTYPGILMLRFAPDGRCEELRECWHQGAGRIQPHEGWGI